MTDHGDHFSEREEIEMLLPWYVTGRLDAADRQRVEAWIARDPDIARQLVLIREEQDAAVLVAEETVVPRSLNVDAAMAGLGSAQGSRARFMGLFAQLGDLVSGRMPAAVGMAAAAAVLLIAVQAATIATLWTREPVYTTASGGSTTVAGEGTFALVRFVDTATSKDISEALLALDMSIVQGPRAGGIYRVRLSPRRLDEAARDALLMQLRSRSGLVVLATPAPAGDGG